MRSKAALLAAIFLIPWSVGFSLAADVAGPDADKELQKFRGTWVMISGETDGKPASDETVKKSKITYEGAKAELMIPDQWSETIITDILKVDPTKTPKEMQLTDRNGPKAGKPFTAIYEFTGDDNYRFAFDPTGKTTPKEFATKPGTGYIMNSWKRVKQ
jgi:uncharacterized protein (TIGR03067 family)